MKFVIAFCALISTALCYSGGAPTEVCDDMTPKHPVDPQKSPLPYTVEANNKSVKAGGNVKISIKGKPFKGYFIQVRGADGKAAGSFIIPANDKFSKTVPCHGGKDSSATHKSSADKNNLVLSWKAPAKAGQYEIFVTVAGDGGTFWAKRPTQTIKVTA